MKKISFVFVGVLACGCLLADIARAQPAASPEEAGITPVTGDLTPWRAYGADDLNHDNVWALALPNGNVVAMKLHHAPETPGLIGGTEFLIFSPSGEQLTPAPVPGLYEADGSPTPPLNAGAGQRWGDFTMGGRVDKVNGTGFVLNHWMTFAQSAGFTYGDALGDDAGSIVQLFDIDGTPVGTGINPFGTLSGEEGDWRDISAAVLSNGNVVSVAENRQFSDSLLDTVSASAGEVAVAAIVDPQGNVVVPPFVVHTDDEGIYLGGSSSMVFGNVVAFDGGFVVDHGLGMRWYNNDGTPRTPSQPDHAELADVEIEIGETGLAVLGPTSGGRGDGRGLASNGTDVVRALPVPESQGAQIGLLIYYNTDGTVRTHARFDDVDFTVEDAAVDRTWCDVDSNGNVFVCWIDGRFGDDSFRQVFGRFFDRDGNPHGPSFPVFESWSSDGRTVDYGGAIGVLGAGNSGQPRCGLNDRVAIVIEGSTLPEIPDLHKQVSNQFTALLGAEVILDEALVRIFQNPFDTDVDSWQLY